MDHFRTFRDTKKKAVENQRLAENLVETRSAGIELQDVSQRSRDETSS